MAEIDELLARGFQERQRDLPEEALRWFVQASELEPEDQTIQLEIARSHLDLADRKKAQQILAAIEVDASKSEDDTEMALELARLWVQIGEADHALKLYRSVPSENRTGASQAILEAVLLLERTHRLDEAKTELGRHPCIPLRGRSRGRNTFLTAALAQSVLKERAGDLESAASQLKRALKDASPSSALAIECGYRLARLLDKLDQPEKARQVVNRCKKVERKQMPVQILQHLVRTRRASDLAVLDELPSDWFDSRPAVNGSRRIIVLGHPRSGTSLLTRQLSGLTGALWVDECTAFSVIARQFGRQQASAGQSFAAYLQSLKDDIVMQFETQYVERMLQQLPAFGTDNAGTASVTGERLIDKNPGLSNSLPALNRLLPGSAWIYVERDPRDVAVSCYFQRFGSTPLGWACLTPDGAIDAVLHTAKLWAGVKARLDEDRAIVVRYEDLVKNPGEVIASTAARLGWPGDGSEPIEPAIIHSPTYSEVRRPIDSRAVGRWQRHESAFGSFKDGQLQLMENLGYH